jgi:tRNA-splicing ligase RtcB (3'-phosphate/5'-hydroxy nucleic acid ligase)
MNGHKKEIKLGAPDCVTKIDDNIWELPVSYKQGMKVPGRVYANKVLIDSMDRGVFDQLANVASLPGIQKYAACMADGHWGYGFPIGGVAAFDPEENGVISPGGVGFDINCGVRLVTTNLTVDQVKPKIKELVDTLFKQVPAGVGCTGFVKVTKEEFKQVLVKGSQWCLENGYATEADVANTESSGKLPGADHAHVSDKAIKRGFDQVGTLGSGNHFLEIQEVKEENIFDKESAKIMGITGEGQVCLMIHCGSRGLGHQVGTDYMRKFLGVMKQYGINILDKELACAPMNSPEGKAYYSAMACAANMAFANRQVIMHRVREVFKKVFGESTEINLVYDVCHNIAKLEKHIIDGKEKELIVHRKGATRAFGPARNEELPDRYKEIGQPVILPGSMETGSYVLVGSDKADQETFASTAHGAGRIMSRAAAKRQFDGAQLQESMLKKGIYVHGVSMKGLAEEAGGAYKDIEVVAETSSQLGIAKKVVKLVPIGNVKG